MSKVCPICNDEYEQTNGNQVYCSYECKEEFSKRRKREKRAAQQIVTCKVCKKEFMPTGKNANRKLTCSPSCSLKNQRDAKKAWYKKHNGNAMTIDTAPIKSHSAKVPKPDKRVCKYCGDEFTPRHNGVKYCDDICKNKQNKEDKAEREKLGIKREPRRTREQEYVPDKNAIFNNQFLLGFMSSAKREYNHSSDRYRL